MVKPPGSSQHPLATMTINSDMIGLNIPILDTRDYVGVRSSKHVRNKIKPDMLKGKYKMWTKIKGLFSRQDSYIKRLPWYSLWDELQCKPLLVWRVDQP